jgi:hypothetical protein
MSPFRDLPIFNGMDLEGGTGRRPALSPQMIKSAAIRHSYFSVRRKLRKNGYFGDL